MQNFAIFTSLLHILCSNHGTIFTGIPKNRFAEEGRKTMNIRYKKTKIFLDVILWIATAVPFVLLIAECVHSFRNGIGSGPDRTYGMLAFLDTLWQGLLNGGMIWLPLLMLTFIFTIYITHKPEARD